MRKKQTEFTLEEARNAVLDDLALVIKFAESLGIAGQTSALHAWVTALVGLGNKIRVAAGQSLTKQEIRMVFDFGQFLVTGIPNVAFQLSTFWSLQEAIGARLEGPEAARGYQSEQRIAELGQRIVNADRFAMAVVREVEHSVAVLELGAILMVHVARVDTIEYAVMRQLGDAVKRFELEADFDPAAMCSVEQKVPWKWKGDAGWRTDVRAIRDAAAHFKFQFEIGDKDWSVEFSNHDHGYRFDRRFTRTELIRFFDTHTLLYKSQLIMLKLSMILHVLVTHFWDGRETGDSPVKWPL